MQPATRGRLRALTSAMIVYSQCWQQLAMKLFVNLDKKNRSFFFFFCSYPECPLGGILSHFEFLVVSHVWTGEAVYLFHFYVILIFSPGSDVQYGHRQPFTSHFFLFSCIFSIPNNVEQKIQQRLFFFLS